MRGLVFSHGWGFDSRYWDVLKQYFSDFHCEILDRGYFSSEPSVKINRDVETWFGIGHSLGFSYLLQSQYSFSGIVGIQCFTNFLGYNKQIRFLRERYLKKMIHGFNENPIKTIRDFYTACGFDHQAIIESQINYGKLLNDLLSLYNDFGENLKNLPALILASKGDSIVPPNLIQDNFGSKDNVEILFTEDVCHGLGIFNPEWCAEKIRFYIEKC